MQLSKKTSIEYTHMYSISAKASKYLNTRKISKKVMKFIQQGVYMKYFKAQKFTYCFVHKYQICKLCILCNNYTKRKEKDFKMTFS